MVNQSTTDLRRFKYTLSTCKLNLKLKVKLNNVQLRFIKTNSLLVLVHVCEFTQSIIITEVHKYEFTQSIIITEVHKYEFTQSIIITEVQKYEFTQSIIITEVQKYGDLPDVNTCTCMYRL